MPDQPIIISAFLFCYHLTCKSLEKLFSLTGINVHHAGTMVLIAKHCNDNFMGGINMVTNYNNRLT